ncbi:MAG TPA: glycoside hydrolase family 43 protein [Opitutaceae bacterium]|nr:glycoside hydrolase family 43 protein [Opitutaceae bacterium]
MKKPLLLLTLLLAAITVARAASGGYLFVTFKGEQNPLTEQIYFALSADGRNWQAMNNGEPALVSQLGEKGVRDPYLLRAHDGNKFYLIATDLSIALNPDWGRAVRAGSRSIVIWETTDLVHWSEPRLVPVAPADAGCTWAPEAIYDEDMGDYLVFWASTTARDDFAKHRIWAARTKDFRTFSAPFIYIEKAQNVIDTTIVRDGKSYFRFTKDETSKAVTMEKSEKLAGTWRAVAGFSLAGLVGYEGPECYPLQPVAGEPATWCLILDYYSKGQGYQPFVTHDLAGGQFAPASGFTFPFRFRHGCVLPLSAADYATLVNNAAAALAK